MILKKNSKIRQGMYLIRQILRSLVRNYKKHILIPFISAGILLFLVFYQMTLQRFIEEQKQVYESIPVEAYYTSNAGRELPYYLVDKTVTSFVESSDNIAQVFETRHLYYEYIGQTDETQQLITGAYQFNIPKYGSFAMESRIFEIYREDDPLMFTDSMKGADEFYRKADPKVQYLTNYSDDIFTISEEERFALEEKRLQLKWKVLNEESFSIMDGTYVFKNNPYTGVCAVTELFMKEHALSLGDTICIAAIQVDTTQNFMVYMYLHLKIVCSFTSLTGDYPIYCPLSQQADLITDPLLYYGVQTLHKHYLLKNTDQLTNLRDGMEELGVTNVGSMGKARVSFVIDDKTLIEVVSSIHRNISVMQSLYIVIYLFILLIGFVIAYLSVKNRKPEFALMRSMGNGKRNTFLFFFTEQFALLVLGFLTGTAAVWLFGGLLGMQNISWMDIFNKNTVFYFLCYIIGTAIAIGVMNVNNVLSILSAKE